MNYQGLFLFAYSKEGEFIMSLVTMVLLGLAVYICAYSLLDRICKCIEVSCAAKANAEAFKEYLLEKGDMSEDGR